MDLIITVLLGLLTVTVAAAAFYQATRANRAQSQATKTAVDAAAYERAKELYESAIDTLQEEGDRLRREITALHNEVSSLRAEVQKLRLSNAQLSTELAEMRR